MTQLLAMLTTVTLTSMITGCSELSIDRDVATEVAEISSEIDIIDFESIKKPELFQKYATVYFSNQKIPITWEDSGDSIFGNYFWYNSSLPGFGYTLLIEIKYFTPADKLVIETEYGSYCYVFVDSFNFFKEDGKIINKVTGENLISKDPENEVLLIVDSEHSKVYKFILEKGTVITECSNS